LQLLVFSLSMLTTVLSVATADDIDAFLTPEALLEAWDAEYGSITTFRISFAEELHGIISETGEKINNDDGILEYQQVQMTKDKRNGRYHAR